MNSLISFLVMQSKRGNGIHYIHIQSLQLPESSGQSEETRGHVAEERLTEIMSICESAAQVATACGEVTLRARGHHGHLFLLQL